MERKAVCPVCGKEFMADRSTHRYCSAVCRRYAYRHRHEDETPPSQRAGGKVLYWKHSKNVESQPVQHAFRCRNCGVLVEIRDAKDRRTAFCSADCRKQWFSLHRNR